MSRREITDTSLKELKIVIFVARSSQFPCGHALRSRLDQGLNSGAILQRLFLDGKGHNSLRSMTNLSAKP
jgi:hypothetical protein